MILILHYGNFHEGVRPNEIVFDNATCRDLMRISLHAERHYYSKAKYFQLKKDVQMTLPSNNYAKLKCFEISFQVTFLLKKFLNGLCKTFL